MGVLHSKVVFLLMPFPTYVELCGLTLTNQLIDGKGVRHRRSGGEFESARDKVRRDVIPSGRGQLMVGPVLSTWLELA